MEVICIGDEAFEKLLEKVLQYVSAKLKVEEKWITGAEAMRKLGIKSKTTLQRLRDEGKIRFSQPQKKLILYDSSSINEYLERHVREIFF